MATVHVDRGLCHALIGPDINSLLLENKCSNTHRNRYKKTCHFT